jgi:flagellar motor switch protein FliM
MGDEILSQSAIDALLASLAAEPPAPTPDEPKAASAKAPWASDDESEDAA